MLSRRLLRIKDVKALYSHFKSESDSLIVSEKNLMLSIDKTYELYLQMLWLVVEVANYAENRIELGRRKHLPTPEELNPNTKFVDNRVVAALRESNALTDYLQRKKLGWVQAPELVKKLYHAMVESDYYRKYMDAPARSFKEDVRLVESFYTRTVGESEALEEALCFGTSNTAHALELYPRKGHIQVGADADLLLMEENLDLNCVIANGRLMMEDGKLLVKGTYEQGSIER